MARALISAEADRSVGSFYQHFAGKDELLQALLADWIAQAGAELAGQAISDDLSQRAALRARVASYWHTYQAHVPEIRALVQAAQVSPTLATQLAQFRHVELDTMRSISNGSGRPGSSCPVTPPCSHRRSTRCWKGSARSGSPAMGSESAGPSAMRRASTRLLGCSATA